MSVIKIKKENIEFHPMPNGGDSYYSLKEPTSEEIKGLRVGDRVLVGHEITDKRGYVPCCKDMIIDTDTIVAILSSSPQKAECKVPKCPSLFCVSGDIDDATRKNITDLFNTQCEIIAYLKEKEAKG
jgi:hypothetical protein